MASQWSAPSPLRGCLPGMTDSGSGHHSSKSIGNPLAAVREASSTTIPARGTATPAATANALPTGGPPMPRGAKEKRGR